MSVTFRAPTPKDVAQLARTMRPIDALECRCVGGHEPEEALEEAVSASLWCYAAEVAGDVACMFGVAPGSLLDDEAAPWLLSADGIERHGRQVLAHARPFIERMRGDYERLYNVVHADNRAAIRFLRWGGFSFLDDALCYGGEPFWGFEMRRADV